MRYNAIAIKKGIAERRRIRETCRMIAALYSPVPLPESVTYRICSRKKLYNFLEAFSLNIEAIMHQYDLSVPRDVTIKQVQRKEEQKPIWLNRENQFDPNEFF